MQWQEKVTHLNQKLWSWKGQGKFQRERRARKKNGNSMLHKINQPRADSFVKKLTISNTNNNSLHKFFQNVCFI